MVLATNLGFPRIGARRELKKALEAYWAGAIDEVALRATAADLRRRHWQLQQRLGLDQIPSNDFSLYDHVLDTAVMLGAVPERYGWPGGQVELDTYFAMARGSQPGAHSTQERDVPAMEMTKWLDTNYHYIVPELEPGQRFRLADSKAVEELREARAVGVSTRPVLLGPVSFLLLGKVRHSELQPLSLLDSILPIYEEILRRLAAAGAAWVQLDEPCLVLDLQPEARVAFGSAYQQLRASATGLRLLVATYFEGLRDNLLTALRLPVDALHLDLVRAPDQLQPALAQAPASLALSLGVVDGRNVWRTDLDRALVQVEQAVAALGPDRVMVAPSCSLPHAPGDLADEARLDPGVREWLAFGEQKLEEVVILARAVREGRPAVRAELEQNREALARRRNSPQTGDAAVRAALANVNDAMLRRQSAYPERRERRRQRVPLPLLPTTTIGSFPQTKEVRAARADARAGRRDPVSYQAFLREEIARTVHVQEELGLDVLVHGESERNDMVEYFGEQLAGYLFTQNGWVQSYGSRCVKPPIIYGDVRRPKPMTVDWSRYAQSLTQRPMKGMLTGPVTMLQWSFVRDDQPRSDTCWQIALALREEVHDLEAAGIVAIQIDEPALREGLPLRRADRDGYLRWAVDAFRLTASGVRDDTQIHTHMCYAEFNDIIEAVVAMDADVISIETSRSQMELLDAFTRDAYPNEIGPGVYDIHSPRVPSLDEMTALLGKALRVLSPEQLWVNPDCGLKTRRWEEVQPALAAMVLAAGTLRREYATTSHQNSAGIAPVPAEAPAPMR